MNEMLLEFDEVGADEVSTMEMDKAVEAYYLARKEYEDAKAISNEKHAVMEEKEAFLAALMDKAKKTKYVAEGVGTVSIVTKLKVRTPGTPEDKAAFFKWLKDTLGAEGFLAYATVNYQSLQSLYNEQMEKAEDKSLFSIDGVGAPTEHKELRFKKN